MIWGVFWKKYRKLIGYLALFCLPFAALFIDEIPFPKISIAQKLNSWIVHPVAESIESSIGGLSYIFKNYVSLRKTKEQNDVLSKENARLKLEILQFQEMAIANARLNSLLNLKNDSAKNGRAAQIIGEDASPDRFTYLINIGAKEGVELRSPVLTPEGIIGQVRELYSHSALVVTLLDPSNVIDTVDVRSRSHALVEGTGREYLGKTKYVDRIEDFRVGDLLLSSGHDGIYPKGYPVGTIVSVEKPRLGVLQVSRIRPSADFDKLEEVLVLPPIKIDTTVQVSTESNTQKGTVR